MYDIYGNIDYRAYERAMEEDGGCRCDYCGDWIEAGRDYLVPDRSKFDGYSHYCSLCVDEARKEYLEENITAKDMIAYLSQKSPEEFQINNCEMSAFFDDEEVRDILVAELEKTWEAFPPSQKELVEAIEDIDDFWEWAEKEERV